MMTDVLSIFVQTIFAHNCASPRVQNGDGADCLFDRQLVWNALRADYSFLTEEKISQILSLYRDVWSKDPDGSEDETFFYTLAHFVADKVRLCNNCVKVRLNELLRWRQLAYAIGEDVLVCSWLAYRFRWTNQVKWNTEWNMSCEADDVDLQYLYDKGLADLHHHLKAPTDVFSISWICLMNHITHRYRAFGKLGTDKLGVSPFYKACYLAASIRMELLNYLQGKPFKSSILKEDIDDYMIEHKVRSLQARINIRLYETKRRQCNTPLDYALLSTVDDKDMSLHLFDGERYLLYGVLKAIFRGCEQCESLSALLFSYLHTKTALRQFFVQSNQNVGFANFAFYESRKDLFLENYPEYERMLRLLPVVEGKQFHHLKYLETRIAPKADVAKMRKMVRQTINGWRCCQGKDGLSPNLIVHFIKRGDDQWQVFCERHHKLRIVIRRQALTMMTLRRQMGVFFEKMVGIDAANTELDCRPEVFAHAFRYVRHHVDDGLRGEGHSTLHYTYHAGEDFYDIVDGLRAIDEAVCLLRLSQGDRLGHCIALGIEPSSYYSQYEHKVMVKKQYLIDNIVWMLGKVESYSITIPSGLRKLLKDKYRALSYELYERDVNMDDYDAAMQLRGDDPQVAYTGGSPIAVKHVLNDWASCALDTDERLNRIRTNKEVVCLYHQYHFNKRVRTYGERLECMTVGVDYVDCVRAIQDCMMNELAMKGIVVECCPSSNLKIGLPNRYDQQPILRFFPVGAGKQRLAVTINTDDLGIFQTSIDNEYSLMALAALKAKDQQGHLLYNKHDTLCWLSEIAENGFKYAFGKCKNNRNRTEI